MGNHPDAKVCHHGYESATCFKCQLEQAHARGFAAGVEAAAKLIESHIPGPLSQESGYMEKAYAAEIRALTKPEKEGKT